MTTQRLEQELECPICLDRFDTPKVLPCQHTFCADCLITITQRGSVPCPECRAVHPVPPNGFPINITMQRLLSASQPPNVPTVNVPANVPSVNVPANAPGSNQPLHPSAPPLDPPPTKLPPVYPPSQPHQPIPSQPAQYHQPSQPQGNLPPGAWSQPSYPTQPALPRINVHGNRDPQPQTSSCQEPRVIPSENEDDDFQKCKAVSLKYFKLTREGIRKVIGNFINKYKNFMLITTFIFLVITFSRFVAGAAKLTSDCPDERRVAEYLFVKSILGFIFWVMLLLLGCKRQLTNAMDNPFVEVYLVLESLFSLIWLIVGSVWIFGSRNEMIYECPFYVNDWNKHFINFALFLTAIDWIGLVAFGFYICYVQFDRSDENIHQ